MIGVIRSMTLTVFVLGDCASFDNQRVLHGRRSFDLKTGGKRLLHGTYIAWDEIRSKMNSIKFRE